VKDKAPYQMAQFIALMNIRAFDNTITNLYELQALSLADLLITTNKHFDLTEPDKGDRESSITSIMEKNIRSAAVVINDFCHYKRQLKMVDYKILIYNDNDSNPGIALPTQQQISTLMLEICKESEPYQLVNFLTFVGHIALYFPNANLYELELITLANLVRGIKQHYTIN
jgi:hypothetical protein